MGSTYDDYVWRLFSVAPYPIHDVVLPKDLEWTNEFTWNPITQEIKNSVTGSIFINEYEQLQGRQITLEGKDDMAWIQRSLVDKLLAMRNTIGLKMTLNFVSASYDEDTQIWSFGTVYKTFNVMFRHSETPIDFESVKRFGNFESDSWFKIKNIRLMEIGDSDPINPCV
jgi:hypothetical protein